MAVTSTANSTRYSAPLTPQPGLGNRIKSLFKEAAPTLAQQRLFALILLICQGGITVTGSIVRVTGSGLGCDTWPNCHPGSLVPVPGSAPLIHQAIEFGNRMLTFVLVAVAIIVTVALYQSQRRQELKTYAWISIAGIVVQAVIGGISVHLDLKWWAVAIHFLPSMFLVWIAGLLFSRISQSDDGTPQLTFPQMVRTFAAVAAAALSIVLITGTMVTGSGPHAGDADAGMEGRLNMDTEMLALTHAACMYVYLILTAFVIWKLYQHKAPHSSKRIGWILIAAIIIQWIIGVAQFRMGVPRWTIPFHICMSSVVTAFTALLYAEGLKWVGGSETVTGSVRGDAKHAARQEALAQRHA